MLRDLDVQCFRLCEWILTENCSAGDNYPANVVGGSRLFAMLAVGGMNTKRGLTADDETLGSSLSGLEMAPQYLLASMKRRTTEENGKSVAGDGVRKTCRRRLRSE